MLASNRELDRAKRAGLDDAITAARIAGFSAQTPVVGVTERETVLKCLDAEAGAYEKAKAGNCYEMANVAFVHLVRNLRARPAELVYLKAVDEKEVRLTGTKTIEAVEPDHAFVILTS
ncbi:MAG: hypothetical protein ACI841_002994 [Planctomycetota bacterium]|jgi:hypothetical protein